MTDYADQRLAEQYEEYPYPERDPREERRRLLIGTPSHLREIDHWVFGARRSRQMPLRVLVAGSGTGDAVVMLATQLAREGRPGEILALDRSAAALRIAEARIAARGLDNVRFVRAALGDLPRLGLGRFDYIDCCGVLHHLPDPASGLATLVESLAPGGGMGLMVYAPHGRTGIYMLQDALARLAPPDMPMRTRVEIARRLLTSLPASNWLLLNRSVTDHVKGGDAGLVDVLLNPRDRPFTVTQFLDLIEGCGLRATCLMEPLRYDPDGWLKDPRLRARTAELDRGAAAAVVESVSGRMSTHVAYCLREDDPAPAADWNAPEAVPIAREGSGDALAAMLDASGSYEVSDEMGSRLIPLPSLAGAILRLCDGQRRVGEIAATLAARGVPAERFQREWTATRTRLEAANRLLLASPA